MGIVYAVLFSNGLLKVGMTKNLSARIRSHCSSGKSFGYQLESFFYTEPHSFYEKTEKMLLEYCDSRFNKNTTEYFEGADFHSTKEVMLRAKLLVGWGSGLSKKDGSIIVSIPGVTESATYVEPKNSTEEKIKRLLKANPEGMNEGLIKNRCRPNEIYEALMDLLERGVIRSSESIHKKNGRKVITYFYNDTQTE